MTHRKAIYLSGMIWFLMGAFLLYKGLHLVVNCAVNLEGKRPLLDFLSPFCGKVDQAALILIFFGLFLGFLKRFILAKSVKRVIGRILSLPEPVSIRRIYSKGYFLLIGSMIGIGLCLRFFSVPNDIHGLIDVAIGSSLMNGALIYFRNARLSVVR